MDGGAKHALANGLEPPGLTLELRAASSAPDTRLSWQRRPVIFTQPLMGITTMTLLGPEAHVL